MGIQEKRLRTFRKDNYQCFYCLKLLVHKAPDRQLRPTVEHIVPLSKGGTWEEDNLLTSCGDCNHRRGNKSFILFLIEVYRLTGLKD